MIQVTIGNSSSKITGLNPQEFKALRDLMSYTVTKDYYSPFGQTTTKCLLTKTGEFPTGLRYIVTDFIFNTLGSTLSSRGYGYNFTSKRPASNRSQFKPLKTDPRLTPYPEQIEAAKAAKLRSRGIIVAPTGVGKSLIIKLMIEELGVPTLVVVPSLELKKQLTASLTAAFGKSMVGDSIKKRPIIVENVDALDPKKPLKGYDCVIIDEYHHSASATYQTLNKYAWTEVYHRFGLTATPFRTVTEEKILLESILSEVIYEVTYQTAVEKGYIVPMEAFYLTIPTTLEVTGIKWAQVYNELVVNNKPRNAIVSKLLNMLTALKASTLCLVKEIKHGSNLSELGSYPFINGQDEDSRAYLELFNTLKITTLVGTTGVIGEGVDSKPCEYIIIAGLGKSRSAFMQQCGRGFRRHGQKESCKIIIFKDNSHKFTKNHFKEQCKILLEEYGVTPQELII